MKFIKYCYRSICKEIAKQKYARTFYFILSSFLIFPLQFTLNIISDAQQRA